MFSVALADGAQLTAHWQASLHSRLWLDPALAPLRDLLAARLSAMTAGQRLESAALLAAATSLRLAVVPVTGQDPVACAGADLADHAGPVMDALAAATGAQSAAFPGADAALARPGQVGSVARFGTVITATSGATDPRPVLVAVAAPPAGADLAVRIDVPGVTAMLRERAGSSADGAEAAVLAALDRFGPILATMAMRPDGILEKAGGTLRVPVAGWQPVDRALLARLPATTLAILAVGVDGSAWWTANRGAILAAVAESERTPAGPISEAQAEQVIDGELAGLGIPTGIAKLIGGAKGTALVAITQGIPFPGVTIAVPRSAGTDALAAWVCRIGHATVPAPGATAQITFRQLPLPASLVCDAGHWLLTTDPVLAGQWASATPGGFADAPAGRTALAQAPAGAVLIGASDTPNVLRTASGYLGIALNAMSLDPQQQQQTMGAVNRLAGIAATGYCSLSLTSDSWAWESRGVLGGGLTACMFAVPWLGMASPTPAPSRPAAGTEF